MKRKEFRFPITFFIVRLDILQQGVKCEEEEHCEVQAQESVDGNWVPPIGVCVKNAMLADDAAGSDTTDFTSNLMDIISNQICL